MKVILSDKVIYHFSPKNQPIDSINLGDDFWVETNDCYSGQIKTEKDLRPNIDISIMDAATGPIEIKGVVPGDIICVEILDIELAAQGVMVTAPGLGPLGDLITEPDTKIIPIKNGLAYFSDELKLPLTPMVGVLGVSPDHGEIHCATPGDNGGNLDTKDIKKGSKVYFPVFVKGANLAVSDLHACMGDGELSGTGIEIAGRVKMVVSKVASRNLLMPIVETKESFAIIASATSFETAAYKGLKYTVELLQNALGLSFSNAYRLLSATCDLKISQIVNPLLTVRVSVPKSIVPKLI